MRKYLILPLVLMLASCNLIPPADSDLVLTEINQVVAIDEIYQVPLDKIPEQYRQTWKDKVIVVSRKDNLKSEAITGSKYVPLNLSEQSWDSTTVHNVFSSLLTGLTGFFPWLAGVEGLLALLFPRKRQHYASAVKNFATLDLRTSLVDLAKGLGLSHSNETTKEAWEGQRKVKKVRKPRKKKTEPAVITG